MKTGKSITFSVTCSVPRLLRCAYVARIDPVKLVLYPAISVATEEQKTAICRRQKLSLASTFILFVTLFACPLAMFAQSSGSIRGQVLDPTGAVVTGATLTLFHGDGSTTTSRSAADGTYSFNSVHPGRYALHVVAQGFASYLRSDMAIVPGHAKRLDVLLALPVQRDNITVSSVAKGGSVNSDENASAIILTGKDLDALSDDPEQLQNELQALAGPAAGPNGGQIYIDGFTGGQLPPKSSIREIRINQNPFSAEFDRIGYGRIEILTKPGSDKLNGHISSAGNTSFLNTAIPLTLYQPSYYLYFLQGDISGPISKNASYFTSVSYQNKQNQSIVNAVNPADISAPFNAVVPHPSTHLYGNFRVDLQLGKANTLTVRDSVTRLTQTGAGVGSLNLPAQAYHIENQENALQIGDTVVVNSHLINETRFQWRRIRNNQVSNNSTPTVTVQGAFTDGGNNNSVVRDHQDVFELQNYSTAIAGLHTFRFGTRLRAYRDVNYSTSGINGNYIFQSLSHYQAQQPDQYRATVVANPEARAVLFDSAFFYQDDWRLRPNLIVNYGLRFETQNRISDRADWAPRFAVTWAPGQIGKMPPRTVFRAGYGWFYNRFTVPTSFSAASGTPYVIQTIHQNGINQQSFIINIPTFFKPDAPVSPEQLADTSGKLSTVYSIDSHFHAALDMQGGVGVDRRLNKELTLNVTYHQYRSNNVTAPDFDPSTYNVESAISNDANYQFQSGGVYNQQQIVATAKAHFPRLSFNAIYSFNVAKSDTQGASSFPMVAHDPGFDYGRAAFDIHHRFFLLSSYSGPHGIVIAPVLVAQSGTPYNITIGNDLVSNNQFNARPTYGTCGAQDVVSTPFGCLDKNPVGKGEQIIPYNLGTGPANIVFHLRMSKTFGIGPRAEGTSGLSGGANNGNVSSRGLSGGQGQVRLDASVPRKYSLTLVGTALNLFNIVNLGTPNGVLNSSLFGQTQSVAGGTFGSPTPGNRTFLLQAQFSF